MHLMLILAGLLAVGQYDNIPRLHWADPDHKPITYQQYRDRVGPTQPYSATEISRSKSPTSRRLLIITNTTLSAGIQTSLNSFIQRLEQENYQVWSITATGGTPVDLRNTIADFYDSEQISGVFIIGDLPVAWYHIDNDYGTDGPVDFPCDLVYTALNATFVDADLNGIYESYTGDLRPVIYLGRLVPSAVTACLGLTETELVNTYLAKDLDFRTGGRPLEDKALSYIDDDWSAWGPEWSADVATAYYDTTAVYEQYTTWSTDYIERWDDQYEHIMVCVHSSPTLHQFHRPGGLIANVPFNVVVTQQPQTHFYNLFACSNCNFVEANCMGSHYIFHGGEDGLVSIGSTKTGSMLDFNYFYAPLSSGDTWGEALRQWFYDIGTTDPSWFYGMTCLGDPTLVKSSNVGADNIELTAHPTSRGVLISWWGEELVAYNLYRVQGETNITRLDRAVLDRLNQMPISGSGRLCFNDGTVHAGRVYTWLLGTVGSDGREHLVGNIVLDVPQLPAALSLAAPRPNPARNSTTLVASLGMRTTARLEVHDLAGRLVRRWDLSNPAGGETAVGWDLCYTSSRPVANGIYIVSLTDGSSSVHQRVVVGR